MREIKPIEPLVLPFRDTARALNVSHDSLNRWEKKGWVQVVKFARLRYFAITEIQRILREGILSKCANLKTDTEQQTAPPVKKTAAKTRRATAA